MFLQMNKDIWRIYYEHWGKQANHLRHEDHRKKCANRVVDVFKRIVYYGFFEYDKRDFPDMTDEDKKARFFGRYLEHEYEDHPYENIKGDLEKMSYFLFHRHHMNNDAISYYSYIEYDEPIGKRRFSNIMKKIPDPGLYDIYEAHQSLMYKPRKKKRYGRILHHDRASAKEERVVNRVHSTDAIVALY